VLVEVTTFLACTVTAYAALASGLLSLVAVIVAVPGATALTPPTIEIVGFLGGAARFIAKPCLKQRVMRFPIIRYRRSA